MIILGAGLSGLLAGALDRRAQLLEVQPSLPHNHHAVLRFREDKIGRALNIPFRKVRVLKAAWAWSRPVHTITPQMANMYARKVTGSIVDRSILDLKPVERFIAPPDLIQQLADMCTGRIRYGVDAAAGWKDLARPLISTIPLPLTLHHCKIDWEPDELFKSQPIKVLKFTVPGADVFQTVYFPDPDQLVYRASITSNELIVECMSSEEDPHQLEIDDVLDAFGLTMKDVVPIGTAKQRSGKILPLPEDQRKALLLQLTTAHGVYSLGRFACWRNSLLDDVFDDYYRIQRMMRLSHYDVIKEHM